MSAIPAVRVVTYPFATANEVPHRNTTHAPRNRSEVRCSTLDDRRDFCDDWSSSLRSTLRTWRSRVRSCFRQSLDRLRFNRERRCRLREGESLRELKLAFLKPLADVDGAVVDVLGGALKIL